MDMPIRIMITLFVALVVGSTIIVFSQQMIERSKEDINRNRPGVDQSELEEQKIIELDIIDGYQVVDLMTECYNKHHAQTFERELCFVVLAKEGNWMWYDDIHDTFTADSNIRANATISDNVEDGAYAFSIYFNPYGASETIEITR